MINVLKITSLLVVQVYFSLSELTYRSKKTDKQGLLEMKSFHSINFDYLPFRIFFFRNLKRLYCFEFLADFSFKDIL